MPCLNHVSRGGKPLILHLSGSVRATKVSVGPGDNNAYFLETGGALLLIDAADDASTLLDVLGERPLDAIVTTHRHGDHWQALAALARTGARLVAGSPDVDAVARGAGVPVPHGVWDHDTVSLGDERLEVIGLVGHTPGSIALGYRGPDGPTHLFTGDSLFPGGPGKTWAREDFAFLMDNLESKVFDVYGDDTVVHPGHGDDTTLGAERPQLADWRARGW